MKTALLLVLFTCTLVTGARAQLGAGWERDEPGRKIHLVDFENKGLRKGMTSLPWQPRAEVGAPPATPTDEHAHVLRIR